MCKAVTLWDGGSTLSLITFKFAKSLGLKGKPVKLEIIIVGGEAKAIESEIYRIVLIDNKNRKISIEVLGIDCISSPISYIDISSLAKLFTCCPEDISRPTGKEIDMLIGMQYAAYHPVRQEASGHLLLLQNQFGHVIAGSHPTLKEMTSLFVKHATMLHTIKSIDQFFEIEQLGVCCQPKCGSCKCGTCHPGGKGMTLKEERELELIKGKISFNSDTGRWVAEYPWIKDPNLLPNNRCVAIATLQATERRLLRDERHAQLYSNQIQDMLDRHAAREISGSELIGYKGAKFYISHHAVMKPDSKSTPCRIVFNSSAKYHGYSLNDFLAKGPSLLNRLIGILLRFRQHKVGFIGDISKMFHSIEIPVADQMTHLFLWRNLNVHAKPSTYAMTRVNMGDRPSSAIAQTALRNTAMEAADAFPMESSIIQNNSYMDDIPGSLENVEVAQIAMNNIESILRKKGFNIKEWIWSGAKPVVKQGTNNDQRTVQLMMNSSEQLISEKVLGLQWDVKGDCLTYTFGADKWKNKSKKVTKRQILSATSSIYDPLGLVTPITVKAKMILRKIWAMSPKIGWDDIVPENIGTEWVLLVQNLIAVEQIKFQRSLTPNMACGKPTLVLFSDGSSQAFGSAAYCRWETKSGLYESRLIASKSRIAPLKIIDIVRLELCGAVLSKRLRELVHTELGFKFERVFHLVDSEIVKAMIGRDSYGFNTFVANRLGEIHQTTKDEEWFWINGKLNISDLTTRGADASELSESSDWQRGPKFLSLAVQQWPIVSKVDVTTIPELRTLTNMVKERSSNESLADRFVLSRFSKWTRLKYTTARVMKLYKRFSKNGDVGNVDISLSDLNEAEEFWIREAQICLSTEINKLSYVKLNPELNEKKLLVVGGRTERWMEATWNQQKFVLLPKDHSITKLIMWHEHVESGHLAVNGTVAQIRCKYWIIGINKSVKSMINKCVKCREKFKRMAQQKMSTLPVERIKPSPPFLNVMIDYFGPFVIRGEVQKRTRGKAYGVLLTCMSSRAVHLDLSQNYSTDAFMQLFRRYASVRGWPQMIYSDNGTQLVGASKELKDVVNNLDWTQVKSSSLAHGTEWKFSPSDAPWYNGCAEALIKSVKKALSTAVGEQVMSFVELQTCLYESAQIVNQRPIGISHSDPNEGTYLCPNDLLLGRASSNVPQGPFKERCSASYRLDFIQRIVNAFWKKWSREVFPSLVVSPKWHTESRDVKVGDIVLVQDRNAMRGDWRKAIVIEALPSGDQRVRRVTIEYVSGSTRIQVQRPVQRLIVLVPVEDRRGGSVQ